MVSSGIKLTANIKGNRNQIKKNIASAIQKELAKRLSSKSIAALLKKETQKILADAIRLQPEYVELVDHEGQLRKELGVIDGRTVMESLIQDWANTVNVNVLAPKVIGSQIKGTVIKITAVPADYGDVLAKVYASYETEKGQNIPWLQWLLQKGSEIVVVGHIDFNPPNPTSKSRTNTNTIMRKTKGKGWGVPVEYSGTSENNFVIRAISDAMPDIQKMIIEEIAKAL